MSYKDVLDIKVNPNLPEDLAINKKEKNIPKDYFDITIDDLATSKQYAIQFQWVFTDGTTSDWSPSYLVTTSGDAPKVPTGFTGDSEFASVIVSWDGTYQGSNPAESFDGFKCINVYAGNSNTYSVSTAKLAGVLTTDLLNNTITIPVDGTYVRYSQPVYIFASALNNAGVESSKALVATISGGALRASDVDLGPGAVTISKLKGDVLVFDNIKAGTLQSSSFLRAGLPTTARIEISSSTAQLNTYPDPITGLPVPLTYPVLPGIAVYNPSNQKVFSADFLGNVSMTGTINALSGYIGTTDSGWQITTSPYGSGTSTKLEAPSLEFTSSYDAPISSASILFDGQFRLSAGVGEFNIFDVTNNARILLSSYATQIITFGGDSTGNYRVRVGAIGTVSTTGTNSRFTRNMLTITTANYNASPTSSFGSSDGDVLLVYTP